MKFAHIPIGLIYKKDNVRREEETADVLLVALHEFRHRGSAVFAGAVS